MAAANAILLEVTDSERLLANIDYTCRHIVPRPKLLIVNFPHNPTTTVVEPEFYVEVVKLAKKYRFMVISDLAYADVVFDDYKTPSFLAAPGALDVGVELTTMSKGYNMAGWRVGFAAGNAEMLRALSTIKGYYDYGMFRPIQIAAIMALRHTDAHVEAQAKIYEGRRDVLCEGLERMGWPVEQRPKATMFLWTKIPEPWASQMNSFEFSMKLLKEGDVVVSPGAGFGPAGEGYRAHGTGGKRKPHPPSRAANRPLFGEVSVHCRVSSVVCRRHRERKFRLRMRICSSNCGHPIIFPTLGENPASDRIA